MAKELWRGWETPPVLKQPRKSFACRVKVARAARVVKVANSKCQFSNALRLQIQISSFT